jgi:hypothetical protein
MSKHSRSCPERHKSFADIVKAVDSDESIVVGPVFSEPEPGPFDGNRWTDRGGVEWRLRGTKRGRLINLINDPEVPVREFDRWTAEDRMLNTVERRAVIDDLHAGTHEIDDFCKGIDIAEARNAQGESEVWIGRI